MSKIFITVYKFFVAFIVVFIEIEPSFISIPQKMRLLLFLSKNQQIVTFTIVKNMHATSREGQSKPPITLQFTNSHVFRELICY